MAVNSRAHSLKLHLCLTVLLDMTLFLELYQFGIYSLTINVVTAKIVSLFKSKLSSVSALFSITCLISCVCMHILNDCNDYSCNYYKLVLKQHSLYI